MLGGQGIYRGSTALVSGTAGTGKNRNHLQRLMAEAFQGTARGELMLQALDFGCVYHWYHDMFVIQTP
jgi:archaellum biogenesis ATPase FlaH